MILTPLGRSLPGLNERKVSPSTTPLLILCYWEQLYWSKAVQCWFGEISRSELLYFSVMCTKEG